MKTTPHNHRYWLKEHQITAFWHGFGISNGLTVEKKHTEVVTYKGNKTEYIKIKPEYMQGLLKDYVEWLKTYKQSWNSELDHESHPKDKQAFLESESAHASRADILEMVDLLQECRIEDNNL